MRRFEAASDELPADYRDAITLHNLWASATPRAPSACTRAKARCATSSTADRRVRRARPAGLRCVQCRALASAGVCRLATCHGEGGTLPLTHRAVANTITAARSSRVARQEVQNTTAIRRVMAWCRKTQDPERAGVTA